MNTNSKLKNIAVLFGGRAVEHEISIITALQLIKALDSEKYNIIPVYISPTGKWYQGNILLNSQIYKNFNDFLSELAEVTLLPKPDEPGLKILKSGKRYKNDLKINKAFAAFIPVDVYLPAFHGEIGEDGRLQGLFEAAGVAYTGSGVEALAVAMNKNLCKLTLSASGIPVVPGTLIRKFDFLKNPSEILARICATPKLDSFPLFIKPNNRGSSVGIGKAHNQTELQSALLNTFKYDLEALVEDCLEKMFEVNVSVMNSEDGPVASAVEIPHSSSGTLSYEDKYMRPGGKKSGPSQGMASLARVINPPNLDPEIREKVSSYARQAFSVLGCAGIVRFDFMIDSESGEIFFNELNPFPGSLSFYLWIESEPVRLYTDNLDHMINEAEEREQQRHSIQSFIGFKAL
jgi:D-alanine-D-alanine ligase